MNRFSLCIEPVLTDLSFGQRIDAAAELGFDAIEFWDPGACDLKEVGAALSRTGLAIAVCTLNNAWGNRLNGDPATVVANARKSFAMGQEIGCRTFIALGGDVDDNDAKQRQDTIDNLKRIAEEAAKAGTTIVVETLNSAVDHKGYFLDSARQGFKLLKEVGSPQIKLLYDIYHMQIMEGNIISTITENIDAIGHFHSAGVPGRHEHFLGENDYPRILAAIAATDYQGFVGLEYWPTYDERKSLADVLAYLKRQV